MTGSGPVPTRHGLRKRGCPRGADSRGNVMKSLKRGIVLAIAIQCVLALAGLVAAHLLVGVESRIREISDLAAAQRHQFLELRSTRQRLVRAIERGAPLESVERIQERLGEQVREVRESSERIRENLKADAVHSFFFSAGDSWERAERIYPILRNFLTELDRLTEDPPDQIAQRLGEMGTVAKAAFASVAIVGGFEQIARIMRAAGSEAILLVRNALSLVQVFTVLVVLSVAAFVIRPGIKSLGLAFERERQLRRELEHTAEELQTHRDHLQHLVDDRTKQISAQATDLRRALNAEKELSGRQRQFVSMVGHEFRTPLAIIDGNAQRILRRRDKITPDGLTSAVEKIRTAVVRLTELMESVLSAARLEAGAIKFEPRASSPKSMILEIAANHQEVNPRYKLMMDVDRLQDQFVMDDKLIRQVVSNLVSNAIKYSPEGSRVWISGAPTADGGLSISVRDEGVGIPASELDRVFERFFRASTSTGIAGTGIGLNMAKTLVEMHGGTVELASQEGQGTTFYIKLPCRAGSSDDEMDPGETVSPQAYAVGQ